MCNLSDKANDHFLNARNIGPLLDADAVGVIGDIGGGNVVRLMLKIDPKTEIVSAARFQTYGCGAAIAAASALTEMTIGKSVAQACDIADADIFDYLDGLPADKMYCAVMAREALRRALADYRGDVAVPSQSALLCQCFAVDAGLIERTVRANRLTTPDAVLLYTKAGGGCPRCSGDIEDLLERVNAGMAAEGMIAPVQAFRVGARDSRGLKARPNGGAIRRAVGPPIGPLGVGAERRMPAASPAPPEKMNAIRRAIDDLRPHLQRDGGDCELVDVDGNTVFVRLSGNCIDCQLASVTISGVQDRLVEKLGMPLRIVPVQQAAMREARIA